MPTWMTLSDEALCQNLILARIGEGDIRVLTYFLIRINSILIADITIDTTVVTIGRLSV